MSTKGELALYAFEEMGFGSNTFDIDPDMISSAIRRMTSMLADWSVKGITLSFPLAPEDSSASEQESNIPDWAEEAIITNLAVRIGPSYGKAVSAETKVAAKNSYSTLCAIFAQPKESQLKSMPKGAGYKSNSPFTLRPVDNNLDPVDNGVDPSGGPV